MAQQTEVLTAAQSYSFTTAQAMQDLYIETERLGHREPTAYMVDGDMTATYTA